MVRKDCFYYLSTVLMETLSLEKVLLNIKVMAIIFDLLEAQNFLFFFFFFFFLTSATAISKRKYLQKIALSNSKT